MELRELTTLRVGGAAAEFIAPETPQQLIEAARTVWASFVARVLSIKKEPPNRLGGSRSSFVPSQ